MGQQISKKELNIKILDIIIYNVLRSADKIIEFSKITTYKELLLYILCDDSKHYNQIFKHSKSDKIKKSFVNNNIIYCDQEYYCHKLTMSKKTYTDYQYFLLDMNYNREYRILELFGMIIKLYKINSLDERIDSQLLDLILNGIEATLNDYYTDINSLEFDLSRIDEINNDISILCDKIDKFARRRNRIKTYSVNNTLRHRQFELKKINRLKTKYDRNIEVIKKLRYLKLLLTSTPYLLSF